jgi:FkbM family methyltransferase
VAGAYSITLEPVPKTFERLQRNINVNDINKLVDARCCAVGKTNGSIKFSSDCDTTNQVVDDKYGGNWVEVPVMSLDEILDTLKPTLIKIDVEGYEPEVIQGARETLKSDSLLAVLLETVNPEIENALKKNGFISSSYDPFTRKLSASSESHLSNNYLWVKPTDQVIERCQSAPKYQALGINF